MILRMAIVWSVALLLFLEMLSIFGLAAFHFVSLWFVRNSENAHQ